MVSFWQSYITHTWSPWIKLKKYTLWRHLAKEEIHSSTVITNINAPLSILDKTSRQKINKETGIKQHNKVTRFNRHAEHSIQQQQYMPSFQVHRGHFPG